MGDVNFSDLIGLITKGGIPAIILAAFYGLSLLVREVRGGKVAGDEKASLNQQIADLKAQIKELTDWKVKVEADLDAAWDMVHSMRYQRDQARIQAERLGFDASKWPSDPPGPVPTPHIVTPGEP